MSLKIRVISQSRKVVIYCSKVKTVFFLCIPTWAQVWCCFFFLAFHFSFNLAFSSFHSFLRFSAYSSSLDFVLMSKVRDFGAWRAIARNQKILSAKIAFGVTSPSFDSCKLPAGGNRQAPVGEGADRRLFWQGRGINSRDSRPKICWWSIKRVDSGRNNLIIASGVSFPKIIDGFIFSASRRANRSAN